MSKAIWCLCILIIGRWFYDWSNAQWRVSEIKAASEHIEKKIDEVAADLDHVVIQYLKDPTAWDRIKEYERSRIERITAKSDQGTKKTQ